MENIDITDAAFSLESAINPSSTNWNSMLFGAILGIIAISMAIYNYYYMPKYYKKRVTFNDNNDCTGGFCTMEQSNTTSSSSPSSSSSI